jgi:hypothetical protein
MTAREESAYLPPLDEPHEGQAVGHELQATVLELVDRASQDVLTDVVRELEKQQWMLRVQLTGGA